MASQEIPEIQQFENDTAENRLKYTFFVVEASSFEEQELWSRHSRESIIEYSFRRDSTTSPYKKVEWQQIYSGWGVVVGEVDKRPVCINVSWARINGKLVMFWYATSQVVDYEMINKWLDKHFKGKWDNAKRDAYCDASNFHHCLQAIEEVNKK